MPTIKLSPVPPYVGKESAGTLWPDPKWLLQLFNVVKRLVSGQFDGLSVTEGINAKQGVVILTGATTVVSNTSITANSRIQLTGQQDGGAAGWVRVSARVVGTSFTIVSSSATDTSIVAYDIFEPAM